MLLAAWVQRNQVPVLFPACGVQFCGISALRRCDRPGQPRQIDHPGHKADHKKEDQNESQPLNACSALEAPRTNLLEMERPLGEILVPLKVLLLEIAGSPQKTPTAGLGARNVPHAKEHSGAYRKRGERSGQESVLLPAALCDLAAGLQRLALFRIR
jgi:hypothetical protein